MAPRLLTKSSGIYLDFQVFFQVFWHYEKGFHAHVGDLAAQSQKPHQDTGIYLQNLNTNQ